MDVYVHVQLLLEGQLFKEIFQEKKNKNETVLYLIESMRRLKTMISLPSFELPVISFSTSVSRLRYLWMCAAAFDVRIQQK